MKRPRNVIQYSFEGGEADPQYQRRADADLWLVTAERMRNVRLTAGGGFRRRPGLARIAALSGAARLWEFIGRDGDRRLLAFRDGEVDVFTDDHTLEDTLDQAPWDETDLTGLQFAAENDTLIIAHRSFAPQRLDWDGTNFALADYEFYTRPDGSLGQPYWRFQETRGFTMSVSGLSGSITVTMSDDVFTNDHVGVRFRRHGREMEITTVTDAKTATATVIQPLYPTIRLTVGSTAGFAVGDQVQSSVDDIFMEVASIVDATHLDVNLTDGHAQPTTTDNQLLGPNAATTLTGVGAALTPGVTVQWDEALMSPVRGYPGACLFHKGRLVFMDFPGAPEIHAFSILRQPDDFDTGDGLDDEAIIDGPGDAIGRRARWGVSSEQFVTLTEAGSYYVGEGPNTPVTPTTVEFLKIGPEPAGDCNPILVHEGIVFYEPIGNRLMLLAPSGQLRRVWGATELLALASEILNSPTRIALLDGGTWGPERYALAINDDGSICAVHYRRDSELTGASLWTTPGGQFIDVCRFGDKMYAVVKYGDDYSLQLFDPDRMLDDSLIVTATSGDPPTHVHWAEKTVALVWRQTVEGEERRADIGEFTADETGELTDAPIYEREYEGGRRFYPEVALWPPIDPEVGPSNHQRVSWVAIDILRSGTVYVEGQRLTPYRASDDVTAPAPLRTGWRKKRLLGRRRDYSVTITQTQAEPLEVRAVSMGVR